jgi:hypothetical protein
MACPADRALMGRPMTEIQAIVESSMCALLRGKPLARPAWEASQDEMCFRDCATYHGVGPLLARRLSRMPVGEHPISKSWCLARDLQHEMAIELVRQRELVRVLDALAAAGVAPLLLKGAALAYSIYPSPALRPRADTDLLIRTEDRDATVRTLATLGYEKPNVTRGDFVAYQCGFVLREPRGLTHVLDVHWRISNTQLFSRALEYAELASRAVPLPALGTHARGLSSGDALLFACMHRVHHIHSPMRADRISTSGGERLIWVYDIHLLMSAMTSSELMQFTALAQRKGMRAICKDGLLRARECFGTRIPEAALAALTGGRSTEPSAAHLRAGDLRHVLTELRSLSRWRDRIALLREHLFPPPEYMLEKYAVSSRAWLPVLYLQRGIRGTWNKIHIS